MQEREIQIAGAVVYWSAGPTRRELLEQRLEALGLGKHTPNVRTNAAALKTALLEFCDDNKTKSEDLVVQSHKNQAKNGFEVVKVNRGERRNDYDHSFSVAVSETNELIFSGAEYISRQKLRDLYDRHKSQLTGAAIGQMLIEILSDLGGVALRPSGGVYWIPKEATDLFNLVATLTEESASAIDANKVYLLRTAMDEQTVRAVRDAITAEVSASAAEIVKDVQENLVTEEAIGRRLIAARDLHGRVKQYEGILGEAMDALKSVVDIAEQAASAAVALKDSNEVFDGVFAG